MQQTQTPMPTLHITNYQQNLDAGYLHHLIMHNLPTDTQLPSVINISIAYMQVTKKNGVYITTLALSILGQSYKVKLQHSNQEVYLAQYGLDLNTYTTATDKDAHVRIFQQAFNAIVYARVAQIIKALTTAYENYKPQTKFRR